MQKFIQQKTQIFLFKDPRKTPKRKLVKESSFCYFSQQIESTLTAENFTYLSQHSASKNRVQHSAL